MGTPIDPPDPGELCVMCWGSPGSPFGIGPTPETIRVLVAGVQEGAAWTPADGTPYNGIVTFFQDFPCVWHQSFGIFSVVQFTTTESVIIVQNEVESVVFGNLIEQTCLKHFENTLQDPGGIFYGGTAEILL